MAIVLPLKVEGWPPIRILTKSTWSSKEAWLDQPMVQMSPMPVTRLGFEFIKCRRTTIDADGFAVFRFLYGTMSGTAYPAAPDLNRFEVRILAQHSSLVWYTIWWGTVEAQLDVDMAPGSDVPYGTREYHCLDGFAGRTRHWLLDRHGVYVSGGTARPEVSPVPKTPCRGHPGFNALRWDGRISGTKETSGAIYNPYADLAGSTLLGRAFYHTTPGNGDLFTDLQSIETAFAEARPAGEVPFYIDGVTEHLSDHSIWKVDEGINLRDFARRVLRRQRGRGVAFVNWDETGDPITGTFVPKISLFPQMLDTITFTPKGIDPDTGSAYTERVLRGATEWGSAIVIDLQGDHRLGPQAESTFQLGDRAFDAVHYLETQGEQIEAVITGALNDATPVIEKRWEDSQATALIAATTAERARARYESVFQLLGLARDWGGKAGNGNAGTMTRADFRCADDGSVIVPGAAGASDVQDTSPLMVEVMRDLPLYAEYNYVQTFPSPRYDALAKDPVPPSRRAPLLLYRSSSAGTGKFLPLAPTPTDGTPALYQVTYQITDYGIAVFVPGDAANGQRTIGDTTASPSLGSAINYTDLVFTLGLRLPHRVRFASAALDTRPMSKAGTYYTWDNAPRRKVIRVPHHHLWLGHTSAIWEVNSTSFGDGGYSAVRGPANASETVPGVIRDDRAALEQIHRLAWNWYGDEHRTCCYELHACGLLPTFKSGADGATDTPFPTLGQLPSTIAAAGAVNVIKTPITVIDYDHVKCLTRTATDWSDFDTQ